MASGCLQNRKIKPSGESQNYAEVSPEVYALLLDLNMKYRPEIDGLRAIAVVPVILFHAGFEIFSGGFVGVDVFFVISGYLITTILIEDMQNKRFSIFNFYERRARRILPALFFVVAITYLISWQFLNPFDLKEVSQSIFATSTFSSNIYFYLKTGYFDTSAELKPLLHTWSLAVEEQYYILFPIFLLLLWRFGRNKILWVIISLSAISLLSSEWLSSKNPSANFYLFHSRAWELLAGSIAAFLVQRNGVQKKNFLALLGLAVIIFSIFIYNEATPFPGVYALVPVLGVVLLILYADKETFIGQLLSTKAFVGIGSISYSAYLWHQPIFALTRQYFVTELTHATSAFLVIFTFILSYMTWRFIENPVRKISKTKPNTRLVFLMSVFAICTFSFIGFLGHIEQGYPERNPNLMRLAQNYGISFNCSGTEILDKSCTSTQEPKIGVWGDSHAAHLAKAINYAYPNKGIHQLTLSACPPVPGYLNAKRTKLISCDSFNSRVYEYLLSSELNKIELVILSSSMSVAHHALNESFKASVEALKESGLIVVLVSSTPRFSQSEQCITLAMRGSKSLAECEFLLSEATNIDEFSELQKLASELDIGFIDLSKFMCSNNKCKLEIEGRLVQRDAGHFSNEIQSELSEFLKNNIDVVLEW